MPDDRYDVNPDPPVPMDKIRKLLERSARLDAVERERDTLRAEIRRLMELVPGGFDCIPDAPGGPETVIYAKSLAWCPPEGWQPSAEQFPAITAALEDRNA